MQPILMIAEGKNAEGVFLYRVKFDHKGKEVDYTFFVDEDGVTAEDQFIKATFCDPFVPDLYRSIQKFHKARASEQLEHQVDEKPEEKRHTA
jgi:hypothetical protein